MKYEVWQQGVSERPMTIIKADSEVDAWKVLKKMGIRNKSKLIDLVEVDD